MDLPCTCNIDQSAEEEAAFMTQFPESERGFIILFLGFQPADFEQVLKQYPNTKPREFFKKKCLAIKHLPPLQKINKFEIRDMSQLRFST